MTERKITALYDTREEAEAAKDRLRDGGVEAHHIDIHDQNGGEGFMQKLKDFFSGHEEGHAYAEGVRRGHFLLTAEVDEARASQAQALIDASGSVNLENRKAEWQAGGWSPGTNTTSQAVGAEETGYGTLPEQPVLSSEPVIAEGVVVTGHAAEGDSYETADPDEADRPDPTVAAPESDRNSIAMDPTGQRVQETDEEREERLRHQSPDNG